MKTVKFTLISLLFFSKAFGQLSHFQMDKKADSLWLKQLIANQKTPPPSPDTGNVHQLQTIWLPGPVSYSPDSCLRIGQIGATVDSANTFHYFTAVQYKTGDKVIDLKLPRDANNYDFQDFPVTNVYRLPGRAAAYLIISSKEEWTDREGNQVIVQPHSPDGLMRKKSHPIATSAGNQVIVQPHSPDGLMRKKSCSVATMVQVSNDSLKEISFKADNLNPISDEQKTPDIVSGNSIFIDSYAATAKRRIPPMLTYDPAKKKLTFLTTYCGDNDEGCLTEYVNVYTGTFKYVDSTFTLLADTSYFSPALESLDTIIATRTLRTGRYTTQITASGKYEWVGQSVLQVLHIDYAVGEQKFGVVQMLDEDTTRSYLNPDYKIQTNGELIFLTQNSTTPNRSGRCGGCEYFDSEFRLVNKTTTRPVFTYSTDSDNDPPTYTYIDKKGDHNGTFYLENGSESREDAIGVTVDKEYWQNNSTYVVRVSDETLSRNFYVHFVTANNKTIVSLIAGKLQRIKQK